MVFDAVAYFESRTGIKPTGGLETFLKGGGSGIQLQGKGKPLSYMPSGGIPSQGFVDGFISDFTKANSYVDLHSKAAVTINSSVISPVSAAEEVGAGAWKKRRLNPLTWGKTQDQLNELAGTRLETAQEVRLARREAAHEVRLAAATEKGMKDGASMWGRARHVPNFIADVTVGGAGLAKEIPNVPSKINGYFMGGVKSNLLKGAKYAAVLGAAGFLASKLMRRPEPQEEPDLGQDIGGMPPVMSGDALAMQMQQQMNAPQVGDQTLMGMPPQPGAFAARVRGGAASPALQPNMTALPGGEELAVR